MHLWVGDWLCICVEEQNLAVLMLNFRVSWVEQKGGEGSVSHYVRMDDRGGPGIEWLSDLLQFPVRVVAWFPLGLRVPDL